MVVFFFKQKTAYEMRISDWSSDVCSSDLTYREMVAAMLAEVRAGRRVCGAFYGHPGVFARVPHKAIAQARAEGFEAHMEDGVSVEDCLSADIGIDPGEVRCQHYKTSPSKFYLTRHDHSAYRRLVPVGH